MSLMASLFGLLPVVPSGITGTKSSLTDTGRCPVIAPTLGEGQKNPMPLMSSAVLTAMSANTNEQLERRSENG
jgi:hypothetical protein